MKYIKFRPIFSGNWFMEIYTTKRFKEHARTWNGEPEPPTKFTVSSYGVCTIVYGQGKETEKAGGKIPLGFKEGFIKTESSGIYIVNYIIPATVESFELFLKDEDIVRKMCSINQIEYGDTYYTPSDLSSLLEHLGLKEVIDANLKLRR